MAKGAAAPAGKPPAAPAPSQARDPKATPAAGGTGGSEGDDDAPPPGSGDADVLARLQAGGGDDGDTSHIDVIDRSGQEPGEKPGDAAEAAAAAAAAAAKPGDGEKPKAEPAKPPAAAEPAKPGATKPGNDKMVPISALTKERDRVRSLNAELLKSQKIVAELMGNMNPEALQQLGLSAPGEPLSEAATLRIEYETDKISDEMGQHPLVTGNPSAREDWDAVVQRYPMVREMTLRKGGLDPRAAMDIYFALYVKDLYERMEAAPAAPAAAAQPDPAAAPGTPAPGAPPAAPAAPAAPAVDPLRLEKSALTPSGGGGGDREPTEAEIGEMTKEEYAAFRVTPVGKAMLKRMGMVED